MSAYVNGEGQYQMTSVVTYDDQDNLVGVKLDDTEGCKLELDGEDLEDIYRLGVAATAACFSLE